MRLNAENYGTGCADVLCAWVDEKMWVTGRFCTSPNHELLSFKKRRELYKRTMAARQRRRRRLFIFTNSRLITAVALVLSELIQLAILARHETIFTSSQSRHKKKSNLKV